jgi:hypothetical protein
MMLEALAIIFVIGMIISFYMSNKKKVDDTASNIRECIEKIDTTAK